jgi:hypothetical protein
VVRSEAIAHLLQTTRSTLHALVHAAVDESVEQVQRMLEVEGMSMIQVPSLPRVILVVLVVLSEGPKQWQIGGEKGNQHDASVHVPNP